MAKRRWQDLSPRTRRFIVIAGTIEGVLKSIALLDLRRRSATEIRGSKRAWALAITFVNSMGAVPTAYLLFGRHPKSEAPPH